MSYRWINKIKQYVEEVNLFSYFLFFHIGCLDRFWFPLLIYNTHKFCLELMENMLRAAAAALRVVPTN